MKQFILLIIVGLLLFGCNSEYNPVVVENSNQTKKLKKDYSQYSLNQNTFFEPLNRSTNLVDDYYLFAYRGDNDNYATQDDCIFMGNNGRVHTFVDTNTPYDFKSWINMFRLKKRYYKVSTRINTNIELRQNQTSGDYMRVAFWAQSQSENATVTGLSYNDFSSLTNGRDLGPGFEIYSDFNSIVITISLEDWGFLGSHNERTYTSLEEVVNNPAPQNCNIVRLLLPLQYFNNNVNNKIFEIDFNPLYVAFKIDDKIILKKEHSFRTPTSNSPEFAIYNLDCIPKKEYFADFSEIKITEYQSNKNYSDMPVALGGANFIAKRFSYDNTSIDGFTDTFSKKTLQNPFNELNSNCIPFCGNFDDNSSTIEFGFYNKSDYYWYIDRNNDGDFNDSNEKFYYGNPGDCPIVGDWDGNGSTTVGIFRPSSNLFHLTDKISGNLTVDHEITNFGASGDTPIAGDWNGDGIDNIGFYRGNVFHRTTTMSGNGQTGAMATCWFGSSIADGDYPIIGDWDNNGIDNIGVYRVIDKTFWLSTGSTGLVNAWRSIVIDDQIDYPFVYRK